MLILSIWTTGKPTLSNYLRRAGSQGSHHRNAGYGCASFDNDKVRWTDILVLCGVRATGDNEDASNRLYKNNRDGSFTDVTEKAGLLRKMWASAVTVGDYDNDGFEDLFITVYGQNVLYRNNGNGTFTDVTKEAGLLDSQTRWGAGCCFVDYDRDGHLDLFVSNYLDFDLTAPEVRHERELRLERSSGAVRPARTAILSPFPLS